MSKLHSAIEIFILRSLQNMGVGPQTLNDIVRGADMYGPAGVLDSVHLVGLISDIGDAVDRADMCSDTLFDILDGDLFLQFKNIESTRLFLSERFGNVNFSA